MDWTQIIIALITSGALTSIVLLIEKKNAATLDNVDKRSNIAIETAQKLGDGYQEIAQSWEHRAEQLKIELDKKNAKIDELFKQVSELSRELDVAHTQESLAKMMICDKMQCSKRRPPYGTGCDYDLNKPHYHSDTPDNDVPTD